MSREMSVLDLQNIVYREGEHYVAQCLNVDISSFGATQSQALENLQEALELYFEDAPDEVVAAIDAPEVRRLTLELA
jgi:predicted RNase H-like HicB family nuclease